MGRLPHGILLSGQGQLGKKTMAIELAKFLTCSSNPKEKRPCQECRDCKDIQKKVHPDLVLVEPSPLHREIRISQIRDLIWKLSLRPYSAPFKIAILDQAHSMTQEAQSCFLKLLEEPPAKTMLILVSEYPEALFPTITSRTQKIKFFPVKKSEIENYIISQGQSKEKAALYSAECLGRPGLAIDFFLNPKKLEIQNKIIDDFLRISRSDFSFRFKRAKDLLEEKSPGFSANIFEYLDVWTKYLRGVLLSFFHKEKKDEASLSFKGYPVSKIVRDIFLLQTTRYLLSKTNINARLAIEEMLIEL